MPDKTTHELQSERSLIGQAGQINHVGRDTVDAKEDVTKKTAEREEYDSRHVDLRKLPAKVVVKYIIYFVALAAVYALDVTLFGPTTEYWVMLATQNPLAISLAKFIAPLCFLAAEVLISLKIVEAHEGQSEFEPNHVGRIGWIALGFLVALVMPLVAAFTASTVRAASDEGAPVLMVLILGVISFACHVLVLFGGKLAHDAKTYLLFVWRRGELCAAEESAASKAKRLVKQLEARVIPYAHHHRRHNAVYTPVPTGPFDAEVVDLLRRLFPQLGSAPGNGQEH
jgi:hypothetical protein